MKYCHKCKKKLDSNIKFCPDCGTLALEFKDKPNVKTKEWSNISIVISLVLGFFILFQTIIFFINLAENHGKNQTRKQAVNLPGKEVRRTPSLNEIMWNYSLCIKNIDRVRDKNSKFCGLALETKENGLFSGPVLLLHTNGPDDKFKPIKAKIEFPDGWNDYIKEIEPLKPVCVEAKFKYYSGNTIRFSEGWILDEDMNPIKFPTPKPKPTKKPTEPPEEPKRHKQEKSFSDIFFNQETSHERTAHGPAYPKTKRNENTYRSYEEKENLKKCIICGGTGKKDCPYCVNGECRDFYGEIVSCKHCDGVGWTECKFCNGTGYR